MKAIVTNTGITPDNVEVTVLEIDNGYALFDPPVECVFDNDFGGTSVHEVNELPYFSGKSDSIDPYVYLKQQ